MRIAASACSFAVIAALLMFSAAALAQDEGGNDEAGGADAAPAEAPAPARTETAPPASAEPAAPPYIGGPVQGFKIQPVATNTYVATHELRGLQCVKGIGTQDRCAVANRDADEDGYPWTLVKCRKGDSSVRTYARSLDNKREISIFEAPPSLATSAETYNIDVRLNRLCKRPGLPAGGKK